MLTKIDFSSVDENSLAINDANEKCKYKPSSCHGSSDILHKKKTTQISNSTLNFMLKYKRHRKSSMLYKEAGIEKSPHNTDLCECFYVNFAYTVIAKRGVQLHCLL